MRMPNGRQLSKQEPNDGGIPYERRLAFLHSNLRYLQIFHDFVQVLSPPPTAHLRGLAQTAMQRACLGTGRSLCSEVTHVLPTAT